MPLRLDASVLVEEVAMVCASYSAGRAGRARRGGASGLLDRAARAAIVRQKL